MSKANYNSASQPYVNKKKDRAYGIPSLQSEDMSNVMNNQYQSDFLKKMKLHTDAITFRNKEK